MNDVKRIVCLANSRKHSGRCIAGKEVLKKGYGSWIRPISARPSAEVSEEERRSEDGKDPRVLDIIEVPIIGPAPLMHQTENYVIDPSHYWQKTGELPWDRLKDLVDTPLGLWVNGDSTYYGLNDRVPLEKASGLHGSLALIRPDDLTVSVRREGQEFGNPRRRVRAQFSIGNVEHSLVVTDPVAERVFFGREDGDYPLVETYLSVSLGEAHTDGNCYKLVAAVISKEALGER